MMARPGGLGWIMELPSNQQLGVVDGFLVHEDRSHIQNKDQQIHVPHKICEMELEWYV